MGRIARNELFYDGCYAHVFSRSLTKNKIFLVEEDFEKFKGLLRVAKLKGQFQIYHYCFMHTHFHLVVEMGEVRSFSASMKELKRMYTYYFNEKNKRVGPLWRERFKGMLIENELYLSACGYYVEMNPVKENVVRERTLWRYSSSRYYEWGNKDELVDSYERQEIPSYIDVEDEDVFAKGSGVGSRMFKILLRQEVGMG
jgi:REP element-mobilizing transposase RayT